MVLPWCIDPDWIESMSTTSDFGSTVSLTIVNRDSLACESVEL